MTWQPQLIQIKQSQCIQNWFHLRTLILSFAMSPSTLKLPNFHLNTASSMFPPSFTYFTYIYKQFYKMDEDNLSNVAFQLFS